MKVDAPDIRRRETQRGDWCGGGGSVCREPRSIPSPVGPPPPGGRPIICSDQISCSGVTRGFMLLTAIWRAGEPFSETSSGRTGFEIRCGHIGRETPNRAGSVHYAATKPSCAARDFCLTYATGVADVD